MFAGGGGGEGRPVLSPFFYDPLREVHLFTSQSRPTVQLQQHVTTTRVYSRMDGVLSKSSLTAVQTCFVLFWRGRGGEGESEETNFLHVYLDQLRERAKFRLEDGRSFLVLPDDNGGPSVLRCQESRWRVGQRGAGGRDERLAGKRAFAGISKCSQSPSDCDHNRPKCKHMA